MPPRRRPQGGPVVHVEGHEGPRRSGDLDGPLDRGVRCRAERGRDPGQVQHVGLGDRLRDGRLVDVRRGQPRGRAAAAVVADPPRPPAAVLLDHQPGRRPRVAVGHHPDPLGPDLPGDEGAQRVVTDAADPRARHTEAGQPDRHVGLRPAEAQRQRRPAAEASGGGCVQQRHRLAHRHDRPRRVIGRPHRDRAAA